MRHKKQPIEGKIEVNEKEIIRIEKQISWFNRVVIFLIGFAILSGIFGLCTLGLQQISWEVKFDSLGSYLAGTSGTMLAFASVIFIYSGLLKQQQQLLRQRSDIDLTLEELQQTREELKGQKEELEKQNAHWEQQRVEDIYFKLLQDFQSIEFYPKDSTRVSNLKGAAVKIENEIKKSNSTDQDDLRDSIKKIFHKLEFAPYFRLVKILHFILDFLHKNEKNGHLLDHISWTTLVGEKKLFFYYLLAYPEKMTLFRNWYLYSEMISEDLADYHLLQVIDAKRFPPLEPNSLEGTV